MENNVIKFDRIQGDSSGNPRYTFHYLNLDSSYEIAIKKQI